jgi:hypothetical protein
MEKNTTEEEEEDMKELEAQIRVLADAHDASSSPSPELVLFDLPNEILMTICRLSGEEYKSLALTSTHLAALARESLMFHFARSVRLGQARIAKWRGRGVGFSDEFVEPLRRMCSIYPLTADAEQEERLPLAWFVGVQDVYGAIDNDHLAELEALAPKVLFLLAIGEDIVIGPLVRAPFVSYLSAVTALTRYLIKFPHLETDTDTSAALDLIGLFMRHWAQDDYPAALIWTLYFEAEWAALGDWAEKMPTGPDDARSFMSVSLLSSLTVLAETAVDHFRTLAVSLTRSVILGAEHPGLSEVGVSLLTPYWFERHVSEEDAVFTSLRFRGVRARPPGLHAFPTIQSYARFILSHQHLSFSVWYDDVVRLTPGDRQLFEALAGNVNDTKSAGLKDCLLPLSSFDNDMLVYFLDDMPMREDVFSDLELVQSFEAEAVFRFAERTPTSANVLCTYAAYLHHYLGTPPVSILNRLLPLERPPDVVMRLFASFWRPDADLRVLIEVLDDGEPLLQLRTPLISPNYDGFVDLVVDNLIHSTIVWLQLRSAHVPKDRLQGFSSHRRAAALTNLVAEHAPGLSVRTLTVDTPTLAMTLLCNPTLLLTPATVLLFGQAHVRSLFVHCFEFLESPILDKLEPANALWMRWKILVGVLADLLTDADFTYFFDASGANFPLFNARFLRFLEERVFPEEDGGVYGLIEGRLRHTIASLVLAKAHMAVQGARAHRAMTATWVERQKRKLRQV